MENNARNPPLRCRIRSIRDLPRNVLERIVSYIPRSTHLIIAQTCCTFRDAIAAQPGSVLTHHDLLHSATLQFQYPRISIAQEVRLWRAVLIGASHLRVLRLHEGVPLALRKKLFSFAACATSLLERLALPDVSSVPLKTVLALVKQPTLKELQLSYCDARVLETLQQLSTSCTSVSLFRTHASLLPMLCVLLLDWQRPADARVDLSLSLTRATENETEFPTLVQFLAVSGRHICALRNLTVQVPSGKDYRDCLEMLQEEAMSNIHFLPKYMSLRLDSSPASSLIIRGALNGNGFSSHKEVLSDTDCLIERDVREVRRIAVSRYTLDLTPPGEELWRKLQEGSFPALRELTVHSLVEGQFLEHFNGFIARSDPLLLLASRLLAAAPSISRLSLPQDFLHIRHEEGLHRLLTAGSNLREIYLLRQESLDLRPTQTKVLFGAVGRLSAFVHMAVEVCSELRFLFLEHSPFRPSKPDPQSESEIHKLIDQLAVTRPNLDLSTVEGQAEEWNDRLRERFHGV